MALFILQPGLQPLGQFDVMDSDLSSILGGEIAVLDIASRSNTASRDGYDSRAAADARDGYVSPDVSEDIYSSYRPVVRLADGYSTDFLDSFKSNIRIEPYKLFYLIDDGINFYGTLAGSIVGSVCGLTTVGGATIGPHSAAGSGKLTLWDKPGLYGVSLTALSADVVPTAAGTNVYDTPLPGELLYREHNTGKMTSASITEDKIALFIELSGSNSLVTTPAKLVGASEVFDRIVIQYLGATFNMVNG